MSRGFYANEELRIHTTGSKATLPSLKHDKQARLVDMLPISSSNGNNDVNSVQKGKLNEIFH